MKNSALAALFLTFSLAGCGLLGVSTSPAASQKLDQFVGAVVQYRATAGTDEDKQALFAQALTILDIDSSVLDGVVPTGTGMLLAQELVKDRPELAPYADVIAKLYTVAIYGPPAPAEPEAAPAPAAAAEASP